MLVAQTKTTQDRHARSCSAGFGGNNAGGTGGYYGGGSVEGDSGGGGSVEGGGGLPYSLVRSSSFNVFNQLLNSFL